MLVRRRGVWFLSGRVRTSSQLFAAKVFCRLLTERLEGLRPKLTVNLGLALGSTTRSDRALQPDRRVYDFTKVNSFGQQGRIDFPGTQGLQPQSVGYGISRLSNHAWGAAYQFSSGLVCPRWFRHHLSAPAIPDTSPARMTTVRQHLLPAI